MFTVFSHLCSTTVGTYNISGICAKFNASIWSTANIISSSDNRIKEDILDINDDNALNLISAIEPKTYKYIDNIEKGDKKVYGFIAHKYSKLSLKQLKLNNLI